MRYGALARAAPCQAGAYRRDGPVPSIHRLGDCIIADFAAGTLSPTLIATLGVIAVGLVVLGIVAATLAARRARSVAAEMAALHAQASRADALEAEIATHRDRLRQLRHDIRGALSPALLASDRLLDHADPVVKRSAEIVVRSVDRAIVLLADTPDAPGGLVLPPIPELHVAVDVHAHQDAEAEHHGWSDADPP